MRISKESYIYLHKRRTVIGLSILLLLMIYFFRDASFILRATTTIAFLLFFYFIDHFFDIKFKLIHYIMIIIIAIVALLFSPLYYIYPNYDKIQHLFMPMLIYIIILYAVDKLKLDLKWRLTFAFFITAGILGLFEIAEFSLDRLFDLKLQGVYLRDSAGFEKLNLLQEPLSDTMSDLILGYTGTLLYAFFTGFLRRREAFPKRK